MGTIPDQNHTVPDRLGSAAYEILKIIESPLPLLATPNIQAAYRGQDVKETTLII